MEHGKKDSNKNVLLSTGASDTFSKQGIYDLAGNVWEWTLEYTSDTRYPCAERGGDYTGKGSSNPVSYRFSNSPTSYNGFIGFRSTLY